MKKPLNVLPFLQRHFAEIQVSMLRSIDDVDVDVDGDVDVYAFCFMAQPRINYVPKC